MWPIKK